MTIEEPLTLAQLDTDIGLRDIRRRLRGARTQRLIEEVRRVHEEVNALIAENWREASGAWFDVVEAEVDWGRKAFKQVRRRYLEAGEIIIRYDKPALGEDRVFGFRRA